MRRKFSLLALFLIAMLSFSSCGDKVTEYYIVGSRTYTEAFTVEPSYWTWNASVGRYEYYTTLSKLDDNIYNDGTATFSVFTDAGTAAERQHPLPFINTFAVTLANGETAMYTETIKAEYYKGSKRVGFFIQSSDLERDDSNLEKLEFKVVLIWTEKN